MHWLALEPDFVRRATFDLELQFAPTYGATESQRSPTHGPVYITGMARSGTTMLLRMLYATGEFRSLTYRDMPFVLAPNQWQRISFSGRRHMTAVERAHADGIYVDYDSPEAFEEVFWETFCPRCKNSQYLEPQQATPEVLARFAQYRRAVAGSKRYLSKNNNNLLRLQELTADTTATILVVYRDPFDTALSSDHQHKRFCESQTTDAFIRRYMKWLGHFEFGLDHRPYGFTKTMLTAGLIRGSRDYWIDYWTATYHHVLQNLGPRAVLINHDALRSEPKRAVAAIFEHLGIAADPQPFAASVTPQRPPRYQEPFQRALEMKASSVHQLLLRNHRNLI